MSSAVSLVLQPEPGVAELPGAGRSVRAAGEGARAGALQLAQGGQALGQGISGQSHRYSLQLILFTFYFWNFISHSW